VSLAAFAAIRYNTGVLSLLVLQSPRVRRRAVSAGSLAAAITLTAVAIMLLPSHAKPPPLVQLTGAGVVARTPQSVALKARDRRAIDRLLDVFVPAAVERRAPLRALPFVTRTFRAGVTRSQWAAGNVPVLPYHARGETFHSWLLGYSHPGEVSVDLLLQPAPRETLGALAFTAVVKRVHGRWLIDSFVPAASFAPERKSPRILAQPDFTPNAVSGHDRARLDARWLLVPLAVLSLIVLVPLAFIVAHWRRGRRAWKSYSASSS
jgi:hypothetical protein